MWIQRFKHFSVTKKWPVRYKWSISCIYIANYLSYFLDSGPLRFEIVRLKESVFDDPGAPTIINGVFVTVQIIVAKRFSFNASVLAIPLGKLS